MVATVRDDDERLPMSNAVSAIEYSAISEGIEHGGHGLV
jgi:hypothetical protein